MQTTRVWTKQHQSVWEIIQRDGVYHATGDRIFRNEDSQLMKDAYNWLAGSIPHAGEKPRGAAYPIWLSFSHAGTMLLTPDTLLLELEVPVDLITNINIAKWGTILNCSYIPKDEADALRHRRLLADYNTSDVRACMTAFFPQIRREIQDSWLRLFDPDIQVGSPECYGTIWEVRKEWVRTVEKP